MQIGVLKLSSNLFLAPLAGYTNLPFRLTVRELGGLGLATTDLVNARSLLERRSKALKLIETCPDDWPLAVQLFGSVPEEMRDAALAAEAGGAAVIDINMGCPVRKVCRVGGGSAMMTDLPQTTRLVAGVVGALKVPVTVKMRLGWDEANMTAPDLARALEDVGIGGVIVHGRTREQGFGAQVNLAGIRAVVEAVRSIPVIGNGDVTTPIAARHMLELTGCQGVSIGRGAFYHPWIFRHTEHLLATGELLPEPSFEERCQVMVRHLDRMIDVFGEHQGCRMFRKVAPWYARRLGPSRFFNSRVVQLETRAGFQVLLQEYEAWRQQFLDDDGHLLARYRSPLPQATDSMESEREGRPVAIPVPRGPVERW